MKKAAIWIDKEGHWFFQGQEITHRKTYLLYNRHLTHDETGRIILRVGKEVCPVEVEDTPFVVTSLILSTSEQGGLESIGLILNDESKEPLLPETLRIGKDHIPYCRARGGIFEARFSRGAYQLLVPFIQHDEQEKRFFISINGKEFDLTTLPSIP
jgi:hypothetical protein